MNAKNNISKEKASFPITLSPYKKKGEPTASPSMTAFARALKPVSAILKIWNAMCLVVYAAIPTNIMFIGASS